MSQEHFGKKTKLNEWAKVSVYLAGPDVLRKDAVEFFEYLKKISVERGLLVHSPFDTDAKELPGEKMSETIYKKNIALIKSCDAVLVNMEPFRGPSADAGTVFELGYAEALNKPTFAYNMSSMTYRDRVNSSYQDHLRNCLVDENGMAIEDFGLSDNLMIHYACESRSYTIEEAIEACVQHFLGKTR